MNCGTTERVARYGPKRGSKGVSVARTSAMRRAIGEVKRNNVLACDERRR